MIKLIDSPLDENGIEGFAQRLRTGRTSVQETTDTYLARIEALNPKLEAFVHVATKQARVAARGLDELLAAGTDLGPLMGVPIAVKDIFTVNGMPTCVGSELDVSDCIGPEGDFVRSLKRAGCVILGKTRTTEFAAGAHNIVNRSPWNPSDLVTKRSPGGSSSGSAVAVSAGLCALAVGSDTGGSVRVPAALCGIFGLKTSTGSWSLDGIFPLSPSLDSVGLLTASAEDAVTAYCALEGVEIPRSRALAGLRFGIVSTDSYAMDRDVHQSYVSILEEVESQGAELIPLNWPTAAEQGVISKIFNNLVAADLMATLGEKRYFSERARIDPTARSRIDGAIRLQAVEYLRLSRCRRELVKAASRQLNGVDALLSPTTPLLPRPVSEIADLEEASKFTAQALSFSRVANAYDLCAASLPLRRQPNALPVGLQVACFHKEDKKLLQIALCLAAAIRDSRIGE
ncbi:MAG: amidase [Salinisphaera sp.]|jgi:aspartyl-tRNA(Asn)/glutamyl-tRNA(Gln) amidotransferase subunit A|nr:amidase [Salinisphaera sp.]